MTKQEMDTLYSVVLRLVDANQVLTPLERRDLINKVTLARCDQTMEDILAATKNNRKLRLKRGTGTENDQYTGLAGELTFDTDGNTLRIHDGLTPGGHTVGADRGEVSLPDDMDYVIEWQRPTAENKYTWYRKYKSGWIEQGGINNGTGHISLPVEMSNAEYTAIAIPKAFNGYENVGSLTINLLLGSKTTTSFNAQVRWNGGGNTSANSKFDWIIYGISA